MPADQNGVNAMKTDIKNTFKTKCFVGSEIY